MHSSRYFFPYALLLQVPRLLSRQWKMILAKTIFFRRASKNKAKVLFSQDQAKASGGLAPYGKLTFVDLRPPRLEKEVFCSFCNRLFRKLRRIIYRHGR